MDYVKGLLSFFDQIHQKTIKNPFMDFSRLYFLMKEVSEEDTKMKNIGNLKI